MVIGLLVIAGIPTTIGVCEALSAQKKANNAAKEKAKFNLTTNFPASLDGNGDSQRSEECFCVLTGGRLWIDHPESPMPAHKFCGYYFPYPSEEKPLGLVSTIADDPPMLNWIFVDKDSHMVRHGGRQETLGGHVIGPWGWSSDEKWLTLEGDDSNFVAIEQENKKWAIFYDKDGRIRAGEEREEQQEQEGQDEDREVGGEKGGERSERTRTSQALWLPVKLHRKMMLGMESRYVKGDNA